MFFITHKKIFFALSGLLVLASLITPFLFGLSFSIDFTGGTLMEVSYTGERPEQSRVEAALAEEDLGAYSLRPSGEQGYLLRAKELSPEAQASVTGALSLDGAAELSVERVTSVGPVVGDELKNKALVAIAIVVVMIVLYVAFAFRNTVPKDDEKKKSASHDADEKKQDVSSFAYGLVAVFVLLHDIVIPTGLLALLSVFMSAEIDILFIMALLAILGYSVNDTIVVFDRVRENLRLNREKNVEEPFVEVAGRSLEETYARSLNTSLTTIFVLVALYIFGGSATQLFALTLIAGIAAGTYSSIALAPAMLVVFDEYKKKKAAKHA